MDRLKPCPFCGGKATIVGGKKHPGLTDQEPYSIICECGCSFLYVAYDKTDAAARWNSRVESKPLSLK